MEAAQIIPQKAKDRILEVFQREQIPTTVKSTLGAAMTGDMRKEHLLFHAMVDTWPRLARNLTKVEDAVAGAPWEVVPWTLKGEEASDSAHEKAILAENGLLEMLADPTRNESDRDGLIKDLAWGYFAGHSVVELYWEQNAEKGNVWCPRASKYIPARFYRYPQSNEDDERLMLDRTGMYGRLEDFPEHQFLIALRKAHRSHPAMSAPLRVLTQYWLAATFGLKWFMNFTQLFGIPFRWVTVGDKTQKDDALKMLKDMASSGAGAFEAGTQLNTLPAGTGTGMPHKDMVDLADKQCDIWILGQTLTSDVGNSGSRALGDVHKSGELDMYDSVCSHVAVSLNQYARSIVKINYGDDKEVPKFKGKMIRPEDDNAKMDRDKTAMEIGIPMGKEWFYNRHGIPAPEEGEELIVPMKQEDPNEKPDDDPNKKEEIDPELDPEDTEDVAAAHVKAGRKKLAEVDKISKGILKEVVPDVAVEWLGPVKPAFDRLAAAAQSGTVSDAAFIETLQRAQAQMPELFDDLNAEALQNALETSQTAMLAGAEEELRKSKDG